AKLAPCGSAIAEELSAFDHLRHFRRHRLFPSRVAALQLRKHFRRMNAQIGGIIISDFPDELVLDQITEERLQIGGDLELRPAQELAGRLVDHRINIELQSTLEHAAQRFQDSALEIEIIFLVENFHETGHAHDQPDHSLRVSRQIRGEPKILTEL